MGTGYLLLLLFRQLCQNSPNKVNNLSELEISLTEDTNFTASSPIQSKGTPCEVQMN